MPRGADGCDGYGPFQRRLLHGQAQSAFDTGSEILMCTGRLCGHAAQESRGVGEAELVMCASCLGRRIVLGQRIKVSRVLLAREMTRQK